MRSSGADRSLTLLVPTERHVEIGLLGSAASGGLDQRAAGPGEGRPRGSGGAYSPATRVRRIRSFVDDLLLELPAGEGSSRSVSSRLGRPSVLASAPACALATRAVVERLQPEFSRYPEERAGRVAFAHAVDAAIGRLRRAGASPERLRALSRPQATLIARAMEGVSTILSDRGLVDPRGAGAALQPRLMADGAPSSLVEGEFRVIGVVAWEADDLGWLEALHTVCVRGGGRGVSVALPRFSEGVDDPFDTIADMLERRWASAPNAPEIEWTPARQGPVSMVVEAKSVDAEARAVVAAALQALDAGTALERVAIVAPDLDEEALEPLRAALSDARIPFAEPRGRPVTSSPEARAGLALLAMAAGPITREQLIELLRAPGVHTGWWTERSSESEASSRASQLARRLRDLPVNADQTGALFLDALTAEVERRARDAWMPRALERLLASAAGLRATTTRRELARRLLALFDTLKLGSPSAGELAAALRAEGRGGPPIALAAMGEGAAAVRALREAAAVIVEAAAAVGMEDAPCTAAELAAELDRALMIRAPGGAAARAGAVRIARAGDLCALEHDLVVVTRLSASAYGGTTVLDPLLDDRLCAELPRACRPAGAREREVWERAALAWTLAGARRIVLTRSAAAEEEDLGPQHPLARAALSRGASERVEPSSRVVRQAARIDARGAELIALAGGAPAPARIAERAAIERSRTAYFLDPALDPHEYSGRLVLAGEADALHLRQCVGGLSPDATIAVTAIERAAGCAFAGFARRVMGVRRTEDVMEAAGARDRGTLVHRALHAAFEAAREVWGSDRAQVLLKARAAAEAALKMTPSAGPLAPPAEMRMAPLRREATAQAIGDALAVVAWTLDDDASYDASRPADPGGASSRGSPLAVSEGARGGSVFAIPLVAAEQRFGSGEPVPWGALELPGESGDPGGKTDPQDEGAIYVDGQIDRIDISMDRRTARVVDYKTGRVTSTQEHGLTAFQLPLYAAVVARSLGVDEVEAIYVRVKSGGEIEVRPKKPQERALRSFDRDGAVRAAREVVLRLWRGDVKPRPQQPTICAHCEARDVCRRPAVMPVEPDAEDRA